PPLPAPSTGVICSSRPHGFGASAVQTCDEYLPLVIFCRLHVPTVMCRRLRQPPVDFFFVGFLGF
ncbi:unnamed protein product, partial [Citrullus colocynthis]